MTTDVGVLAATVAPTLHPLVGMEPALVRALACHHLTQCLRQQPEVNVRRGGCSIQEALLPVELPVMAPLNTSLWALLLRLPSRELLVTHVRRHP